MYHFPRGRHVFPADPTLVLALDCALRKALCEQQAVEAKQVNAAIALMEMVNEENGEDHHFALMPFALRELRKFLDENRIVVFDAWKQMRTSITQDELARIADAFAISKKSVADRFGMQGASLAIPAIAHAALSVVVPRIDVWAR